MAGAVGGRSLLRDWSEEHECKRVFSYSRHRHGLRALQVVHGISLITNLVSPRPNPDKE
jgi:hypothetical protein